MQMPGPLVLSNSTPTHLHRKVSDIRLLKAIVLNKDLDLLLYDVIILPLLMMPKLVGHAIWGYDVYFIMEG